ncbi:MAG: DUF542 domain-containing protein, partial [Thermoanaerobaculia bacterium]|nr:DUF542 domain-containing protein [Thermoanaerobaculia bacterium]
MVNVEPSEGIGSLATKHPESIPCLNKWHLDFPCSGDQSLKDACRERGVDFEAVADDLRSCDPDAAPEIDWSARPITDLVRHIVERYHDPSRARLARMDALLMELVAENDSENERFLRLQRLLGVLREDLFPHMLKEETTVFPWVEQLEDVGAGGEIERPFFGTIENPMNMMTLEHGYVVELLGEVSRATDDFRPPEDASAAILELYRL